MSHLRQMNEGLYLFANELNHKYQRVNGLNDTLFEGHDDKYNRLFPLLAERLKKNPEKQN
jgi:hypothetical protein